jgi:hypothetical protein
MHRFADFVSVFTLLLDYCLRPSMPGSLEIRHDYDVGAPY